MVRCKPVGNGNSALKYLAHYIYRVAITNNRIEKLENWLVSFRFKNSDTDHWQTAPLPVFEFIRRFLQHVLPKGFVKIRYYGFLSPNKRNLLGDSRGSDVTPTDGEQDVCPDCDTKLRRAKFNRNYILASQNINSLFVRL